VASPTDRVDFSRMRVASPTDRVDFSSMRVASPTDRVDFTRMRVARPGGRVDFSARGVAARRRRGASRLTPPVDGASRLTWIAPMTLCMSTVCGHEQHEVSPPRLHGPVLFLHDVSGLREGIPNPLQEDDRPATALTAFLPKRTLGVPPWPLVASWVRPRT
jgi:hypothetical protein